MKRLGILSAMLVLLVFLNSCLTTLHPIFTPADLVYKPELIGTWKIVENKEEKWADISRLVHADPRLLPGKTAAIKDKGYLITYKDSANTISKRYIAFLARIGKHLYFDYYPADLPATSKMDDFYRAHFVKMHTPYRLEIQKEGGFTLSQLESGYMNELIEQKKIRIRHEKKDDEGIVITAPTIELQQYILKYGDDPEAYSGEKISFAKIINPKLY